MGFLRVLALSAVMLLGSAFVAHAPLRPAQPAAAVASVEETTFFDVGLDDGAVPFDDSITAARKCGFCIG